MAVTMIGTIKSGGAFEVNGKNGKQLMISFNVADEVGTMYACQMWPDDPQHQALASVIANARRRQIKCTFASYSVRKRIDQNNNERIQANFIVTDVYIPGLIEPPQQSQQQP